MSERTGRYAHVLGFALSHPWNMLPEMVSVVASILARRIAGQETERTEIEAALVNRKNLPQPRAGSVAVIPIYGVLAPRINMMSEMSGGTTYERLSAQLREAMVTPDVRTIVLDIDSPGGSVAGNTELATEILQARAKKPIVAQVQYLGASAAYQLAAAATEVVAAPSARVGSIGTYAMHTDLSEALATLGVKHTYVFAGDGKIDGAEDSPPSADFLARLQTQIDEAYRTFVKTVVRGRGQGLTEARVRDEWKAYVYSAPEALSLGMIDKVATLRETLARLLDTASPADRAAAAALDAPPLADTSQEPAQATDQDRHADLALERHVLELLLP